MAAEYLRNNDSPTQSKLNDLEIMVRDSDNDFARMYSATGPSAYVVRPDGYLAFASSSVDIDELAAHLSSTFASA